MLKSAPHPLHVPACCLAIALERLAWYALLAGLVTWLARFGHSDGKASLIVGYVVSAAYAAPLLGAQVADRLAGYRLAAVLGALAFAAGYALMGLSAPVVGLVLVSVGNGLFKPSIMSLLSGASMAGSPERVRDNGRLYAAINVGSLPAGLVGGYLSAGHSLRFLVLAAATASAALVLLASWRVLRGGEWRSEVEALTQAPMAHQPVHRAPWAALGALLAGALAFWSVYNLSYGALVLHAKHAVDRAAFGRVIPPEWFSSLNPAFIIALTPLVAWFDRPNPQNGRARSRLGAKLVIGMGLVALSFVVLSLAPSAHPGWLVLAYALLSAGELLVSAAAISAVTSWAPRGQTARFLSLYFLTISAGGWVAGAAVGEVSDLRALFRYSATAAGLGMMWFLLNAARFDRQEATVRLRGSEG